MNIAELQKQIEILTDQINDIFHATELNFDAIKIQLQIQPQSETNNQKNSTSTKNTLIYQCQKQFKALKAAYQQRSNLRLQYLINQQIKSQEEKVRRQRLLEYEDKIYDHRRLICDKQSFYDTLIKPKVKRPPGFTNDQFQDYRIKEAQREERSNFMQLQEETQMLVRLQKVFRNHRIMLEQQFEKLQKMETESQEDLKINDSGQKVSHQLEKKQVSGKQPQVSMISPVKQSKVQKQKQKQKQVRLTKQQQREKLLRLTESIPTIYSEYDGAYTAPINLQTFEQGRKLMKEYFGIRQEEKQLMKEYNEERQMYRYLKWQKDDLVKKYKQLQEEIRQLRENTKPQKKRQLSK